MNINEFFELYFSCCVRPERDWQKDPLQKICCYFGKNGTGKDGMNLGVHIYPFHLNYKFHGIFSFYLII